MAWKFTLLGIEKFSDLDSNSEEKPRVTRRLSNSKKSVKHRANFTKAVQKCHSKTKDKDAFGRCMSKELKK